MVHFLNAFNSYNRAKAEVRSQNLNVGLPQEGQEPNYLSHHFCLLVSALARSWHQELEL